MESKKKLFLVVFFSLIILAGAFSLDYYLEKNERTPAEEGFSSWLLYENEEFDFSLRYPDSYYVVAEDPYSISFQNKEYLDSQSVGGEFYVTVHPNPSDKSLEEWYDENSTEAVFGSEVHEENGKMFYNSSQAELQKIDINGLKALEFSLIGGYPVNWEVVLVKNNQFIFEVQYSQELIAEKEIFEQMLSSFRLES